MSDIASDYIAPVKTVENGKVTLFHEHTDTAAAAVRIRLIRRVDVPDVLVKPAGPA